MSHSNIKNVVIVGGTHGNEFTGVFLLKKWQKHPQLIKRDTFASELLLANPQANAVNRRFVDNDLNRCFAKADLNNFELTSTEDNRAKVINQQLGPKGDAKSDFIIDLHTTTANMGVNLVLVTLTEFHVKMAAYLLSKMDNVTVTLEDSMGDDHHFLCAIAEKNCIIEVGPVPQGVNNHHIIEQTELATQHLLDFADLYNKNELPELDDTIDVYQFVDQVDLPLLEDGSPAAMVHKSIQNRDFEMIHAGDPMMVTIEGDVIEYQGPSRYLAFVNEAAYYVKSVAFFTLEKQVISLADYS